LAVSAIEFLNDLGHRVQTVCQDTRVIMFLMQRLSVAMQRENAACILGTIADDDFSTELCIIRPFYLYYSNLNI